MDSENRAFIRRAAGAIIITLMLIFPEFLPLSAMENIVQQVKNLRNKTS